MPTGEAAIAPTSARPSLLLPRVVLGVAILLAYANTFSVPFIFDDAAAVLENPSIRSFGTALTPPPGLSVTGRPLVNVSLALNHAISGDAPWSYHALNLALHLGCALALYTLARRALRASHLQLSTFDCETVAFAAAALWALHPLATSAVTYVMQRSELMVSFCYLLTLSCFACATADHAGRPRFWLGLSVVACVAGMATKEVMVTAPLAVLLYDRTFVAGSLRAALRSRARYYVALAATWLLLALLVFGTENRGLSAGFGRGIAWSDYALTQLYAVPHYLRLALWPSPLVFDYGNALIRDFALITPGALLLLLLLAATLAALRRCPAIGFCGALFFLLLAPSSSVVPVATQTIAEHRVYLALAAPVLLLVLAVRRWFARAWWPVSLGLALLLGGATFARNYAYTSAFTLWRDTAAKAPASARAHYNLGASLLGETGTANLAAAVAEFTESLRLDPEHPLASRKLGVALLAVGRPADALPRLEKAVRLDPNSAGAHYELGNALAQLNRTADAAAHYTESLRLEPDHAIVHYNLGTALAQLGRYSEALAEFDATLRLDPQDASARGNATRIRAYLRDSAR
jgi:protein O-mannosyl-transferase